MTAPRVSATALLLLGLLALPQVGFAGTGRLLSSWMSRAPQIDGRIRAAEWSSATQVYSGGSVTVRIGNDGRALYLGVLDGGDSTPGNGDRIYVLFDDEGGVAPILDDSAWTHASCQTTPNRGEGGILFGPGQEAWYDELKADGSYCPVQDITGGVRFRMGLQPEGMTYEAAIPLDGSMPLSARPGERLGVLIEVLTDNVSVFCLPSCSGIDPARFRNLILASGGCNSGPQRFGSGAPRTGLPLDWSSELDYGSGQGWIQSLPAGYGDGFYCEGNDTGGTGAAACVANVLQTSSATMSRLRMPVSLAGHTSARVRLRATFGVDPNGFGGNDAFLIGLLRQDGTTDLELSWAGQNHNETVDLPLSLVGSPPVELLFAHQTSAGDLEGGYAQIDDVELLCDPLFVDDFESGDTSAW